MTRTRAATLAVTLLISVAGSVLTAAPPATAAPATDALDGATVAVESVSSGRLDLFTRGSDNALHWKTFSGGAWTGWSDLGGNLSSAPTAVSWNTGRIDVFAKGANNTLVQKYWLNGVWSAWFDLGGSINSAPTAASWANGRLDVFARGAGNAIFQKWYSAATGWSSWISMGGEVSSAPAAGSYQSGHLAIVARGINGPLFIKQYLNNAWSGWSSLAGAPTSAASVISRRTGHLEIFTQTAGNTLQHRSFENGAWAAWAPLGTGLSSAPAAAVKGTNQIDVFSASAAGDLQQKAWTGTWPAWAKVSGFAQSLPIRPNARTIAFQGAATGSAVDPITYAYVDNIGKVRIGQQTNPDNFSSLQFTTVSGNEAFTGDPAVAEQPDSRVQVAAQNIDGDTATWTQTAAAQTTFGGAADAGGWLVAAPALGRPADGRLVLFGVDGDGKLWAKRQTAVNGAYGDWTGLGDVDLATVPTIVNSRNGLALFAVDTAGILRTAEYSSTGTLSAWTALSSAAVSTPATVVYPGFRLRVFVRAADGSVQSKLQNTDGTWPAGWETIGTFTAAGPPAAILDPVLSRTAIVARGADNEIYRVFETAAGSNTWGEWSLAGNVSDPAATDPSIAPITNGSGQGWIIVFRNVNDATRVYERQVPGAALKASAKEPGFTGHTLPAPPEND